MSTDKENDPLDEAIDQLLQSEPIDYSAGLTKQILAASEEITNDTAIHDEDETTPLTWLARFALPIAAAIAVALIIPNLFDTNTNAPTEVFAISTPEPDLQEIFELEESLDGLTVNEYATSFDSLTLTLDALLFESES